MWLNRNRSPAVAPSRKTGSSGDVDALPAVRNDFGLQDDVRSMTKKQAGKGRRLTTRYTLFGAALALFCILQAATVLHMETKHAMHHATKVFALSHALAFMGISQEKEEAQLRNPDVARKTTDAASERAFSVNKARSIADDAGPGRFMIFPFTQYGPNVQLLGLRQTLSICNLLDVICIEPGFSDLFVRRKYRLEDFYNVSSLGMLPRSSVPSPLKPNVLLYGEKKWPTRSYWRMHNITYQPPPAGAYAKTVLVSSPNDSTVSNVERVLSEVKQELKWFRKTTRLTDHVVALVYSAMLGKARNSYIPPKPLTIPFKAVFSQFKPKDSLLAEADKLLVELFKGEKFLAVHLRLRDHCKTSIDECCCETSGNLNRLTRTDIENFIDAQRDKISIQNVFISGPPSLERMAKDWPWAIENAGTVKLWYSNTAPGSLEESVLQQIVCSKAAAFFYSNPSSTWSLQSKHWQDGDSVYEQLGKVDEL